MGFLRRLWTKYLQDEIGTRAAALAYYALFSFFPLLLLVIGLGGYILGDPRIQQEAVAGLVRYIPAQGELLDPILQQVIQARGRFSLIGTLTLLWAASSYFSSLYGAIHRIFDGSRLRAGWKIRVYALWITLFTAPLLVMPTLLTALSAPRIRHLPLPAPMIDLIDAGLHQALALLLAVVVLYLYFRHIPLRRPPALSAAIGASTAALLWTGLNVGFAWYLKSGLVQYNLVYGSIASVIALVLWLYLSSLSILVGAEVAAILAHMP